MDNRISLYAAQNGKCAIIGKILELDEIHCHHKVPRNNGGMDKYQNLVIIHKDVHRLLHATEKETISRYLSQLKLNDTMLVKLNKLREIVNIEPIAK
jgi:CRISPR/Cas system Type II protein with McrA/HNH and RuvC-like nuclease domain